MRFLLLIPLLFSFGLGNAQDSLSTEEMEKVTTRNIPKNLNLSHIAIQKQTINFQQLNESDYRQKLAFGEALSQSFDALVPFYHYPVTMNLPHYLNDLTFHFSAIDWKAPHKIKYSYYLEGLENNWSEPTTDGIAEYANLWHGTYTLKVKTMGAAQIWSAPFSYTFSIQRPWWLSWWAYIIYGGLILATGIGIYRLIAQRKAEAAEIERLLAENRLLVFSNNIRNKAPNEQTKEDSFLDQVNKTLEAHLSDENFGIAELCKILKISRAQLHRKLKKLTGQSTSHYIRSLRLDIAKGLLQKTDLNVSEVAFTVGFSNATYFSKVFKEEFGYAPREARL